MRRPAPETAASEAQSGFTSLILFFLSLFLILCQIQLFAAELSDAAVFCGSVVTAGLAAFCLARLRAGILPFLLIAALSPHIARACIMFPRALIDTGHIGNAMLALDSLLLRFDRNMFVFLAPYYWTMAAVYAAARFPLALPAVIAASDFLLAAVFSIGKPEKIELYTKPLVLIITIAAIVFLQSLALIFSVKRKCPAAPREKIPAALLSLCIVILGGALMLKPAEEGAVSRGGGLLEPKLFSFDFAPFLHLENEISMDDNLIFITRKSDADDSRYLLRRFVLSAFDAKTGWTRHPVIDEEAQPNKLPARKTSYQREERLSGVDLESEYFLVNIDAGAFIALAQPLAVTPYQTGESASFKAAYSVLSEASNALPYELIAATDDFSRIDVDYYTRWSGDERIRTLALDLTAGITNYWEKVQALCLYLKYGDYRYSLKPGTAADGDQLGQFLFGNKKGYCSYFAFAFASLLRSVKIPARIAVGFFTNPEDERLGFYPVRANMAHAWVEVYFPGFGWIEFDPTTDQLAAGETFSFGEGLPPDFEDLIKEILTTRRIPKEGGAQDETAARPHPVRSFAKEAARFVYAYRFVLCALLAAALLLNHTAGWYIRARMTRRKRKKAVYLYRFTLRLLSLKAYRKKRQETEAEFIKSLQAVCPGAEPLYQITEKARFAPVWSEQDEEAFMEKYRAFLHDYRALKRNRRHTSSYILLCLLFTAVSGEPQEEPPDPQAEALLAEADAAQMNENWEKAVELYTKGKALYPGDLRFPLYLGDIYYNQLLYKLAFDEYRSAEANGGDEDLRLLYALAQTAGHLNRYEESAGYYERILRLYPDDMDAIANLGWMYFKLHRLQEGAAFLEDAVEQFGNNLKFSTTLAIIYSDRYRYEESSDLYQWTIAASESAGRRQSTALAHYNYSILENRFYHYERAFAETEHSLFWEDRFSGRLARGEMYLGRYDFAAAAADYEAALETDPTTLSKLSLANVRQIQGRLDEALILAREALEAKDLSWMLNFGINEDQYKRDVYELLYKINKGLYYRAKRTVSANPGEWARNNIARIKHYFSWLVSKHLFEKYGLAFAQGFAVPWDAAPQPLPEHLEALGQYTLCFAKYPRRAASYAAAAQRLETSLVPESAPSYRRIEGDLHNDAALLENAVQTLDAVWQAGEIEAAYTGLYRLYRRGDKAKAQRAAENLYRVNRGALLQNGIPLPVALRYEAAPPSAQSMMRVFAGMIRKSGFALREDGAFTLGVHIEENAASAEIYETASGKRLAGKTFTLGGLSRAALARLARDIAATAFTAE